MHAESSSPEREASEYVKMRTYLDEMVRDGRAEVRLDLRDARLLCREPCDAADGHQRHEEHHERGKRVAHRLYLLG